MFRNVVKILSLPVLTCSSFSVYSNSNDNSAPEKIEVLGSRIVGKQSAKIIYIENSLVQPIESVLSAEPAIQYNANGGPGSINEIYLRGADSNYTLMSFNGIPLNDGTNSRGGVADITFLNGVSIDRIEIAKGAQSSIYGSQALSGAIDFVSEPSSNRSEPEVQIRSRIDSEKGYLIGASADYNRVSVDVSSTNASETYSGSSFESQSLAIVAAPNIGSGTLRFTLLANKADAQSYGDDSGGALFSVTNELELRDSEDVNIGVKYDTQALDGRLSITGYTQTKKQKIYTPSIPPGVRDPQGFPISTNNNKLSRSNIGAHYQQEIANVNVILGADFTTEKGESTGILDFQVFQAPTDFLLDRNIFGVFSEVDFQLNSSMNLHLFARYDDTKKDHAFSPGAKFAWSIIKHHRIEFEWGKGFKLPSFYALGHPLIGNPELKSEKSETLSANYIYTNPIGLFTLSIFDNDYSNLVDFDPGPPPKLVNRDKSFSKGAEFSFNSTESNSFISWRANYSYTDSGAGQGNILLGRSRHRANIEVKKRFPGQQVELILNTQYIGTQFSSSIPTGQQKLDASFDVSLAATWRLFPELTLGTRIDNALNDKIENTVGNQHSGRVLGLFVVVTL